MQLEEIESQFGEHEQFLTDIVAKREELLETFEAQRQSLADERQRRAQGVHDAALRILQRAMLEDALPGFKREIEAVVGGVSLFQAIDHPQTLQVVLKPTKRLHAFVERILPRMTKRGMPQIMRQRDGLHQILIDLKRPGNGTPQLGNLQGMRQPRTKKVTFMVQEHLRLVDKAPERGGVNDAVAIPLVVRAGRSGHLRVQAPFAVGRMTVKRGKIHGFALKRPLALIR